jgi:hypothetical protein
MSIRCLYLSRNNFVHSALTVPAPMSISNQDNPELINSKNSLYKSQRTTYCQAQGKVSTL